MSWAKNKLRDRYHSGDGELRKHEQGFEFQSWEYIQDWVVAEIVQNKIEINIKIDGDWILNFWFKTENTNCCRIHCFKGGFNPLDEKCNEGGGVEIYINGEGPFLLKSSNRDNPPLLLRIYERQPDSKGYVEFGNAILQEGENKIINPNRIIEFGIEERGNMGVFSVKASSSLPKFETPIFDEDFGNKERGTWGAGSRFNHVLQGIFEPNVGYHTFVIPRSYFFTPYHRKPHFSENWLAACILFSYKRFGVTHPESVPTNANEFIEKMYPVAQAFPLYVSRLLYTPDFLRGVELEIYSRDVLLIGGGDCEDFAYLLQEIYLYIRKNKHFSMPLLQTIHKMMQYYLPLHILCQASQPKMLPGGGERGKFDFGFTEDALLKAQKEMKCFHVYASLLPIVDVANYFRNSTPPDKALEKWGFDLSEKEFCRSLPRFVLEGTSSIFAYHTEQDILEDTAVMEIGEIINKGGEPFVGFIFLNFKGGSRMYGPLVQVGCEEFFPLFSTGLATVKCDVNGKMYLGPAEPFLSSEKYNENIILDPSLPIQDDTSWMENLDPPYPIMDLDFKIFVEKLNKITFPSNNNFKWSEKEGIEFLPYNLSAPNAKPIFISPC